MSEREQAQAAPLAGGGLIHGVRDALERAILPGAAAKAKGLAGRQDHGSVEDLRVLIARLRRLLAEGQLAGARRAAARLLRLGR